MATEETARLFLELVAKGVQQTGADLGRLAGQTTVAEKGWTKLTAATEAFGQMASRVAGTAKQLAGIKELIASGDYEKLVRAQQAVSAELQRVQTQVKLSIGWQQVQSGEYLKQAQAAAVLSKEQQKLADAQRKLDIIAREGKFVGNLKIMEERLQGVGKVGAYAFGILSVSLGGWVRAGLQGTAELQRFHLGMQQISREIASAFTPWIQKAVDGVTRLSEWFRKLTGEQQAQVRQWVALAAAISGTMILLPRLVGMLATVTAGFKAVGLARLAALTGPIGVGVAAGVGVLASTQGGRDALGNFLKAIQPLLNAFGSLASKIVDVAGPALEALSGWLASGVDALARFIEALGKAINWLADRLGLEREATLEELRAWVDHLEKARRENAAELERIARERTAGALGGEAYLEEQRRRLERMTAGPQKTTLSQAPAGFEGAEDFYTRIATTAAKTDQARAADAAEATQETLEVIARQLAALTGWSFEQAMERVRALPQAGAV